MNVYDNAAEAISRSKTKDPELIEHMRLLKARLKELSSGPPAVRRFGPDGRMPKTEISLQLEDATNKLRNRRG